MSQVKKNILLVGSGGVGTIAALNLELGGLATVTAVLRSNFDAVDKGGFTIESCDHGLVEGWRPSHLTKTIPSTTTTQNSKAFDYLVCTTKNIPDIPPSLPSLLAPAITPGVTTIVLIQNGLNIEKPFLASFPTNTILSGVSMIGSNEQFPGHILHDDPDVLYIGAFPNPALPQEQQDKAAKEFIKIYSAAGKTNCTFSPDVPLARWKKLVYNAALNPICALTDLDTSRIRLADDCTENLVRPAMLEIVAAAKAAGHDLDLGLPQAMIDADAMDLYLPPSMLGDVRKGNFVEVENLLGEPLREGEKRGVHMPVCRTLYFLLRGLQWRTKEGKGLVVVPPKREGVAVGGS